MRTEWIKHWAIFSAPILLMLFALWSGFATEADVAAFFKEHSAGNPEITMLLTFITDWSNPFFYLVYGLMLFNAFRVKDRECKRFIITLLIVQAVVALGVVHLTKHFVGRPRPGQGWYFDPLTTRGNYHSLPSGHTTEITGWALPLALSQARYWVSAAFALLIGLVGFSRIYLGWHHPSDVFFGWLLDSFGGFVTVILAESSLFRRKAA